VSTVVRKLVQSRREPLGKTSRIREDQRRAMLLDQLEQLGVDRRPDRLARRRA
jgi:hypothetical protein